MIRIGSVSRNIFFKEIPSILKEVDAVFEQMRAFLEIRGLRAFCFPLELALREAINNAIIHGNNGKAVTSWFN